MFNLKEAFTRWNRNRQYKRLEQQEELALSRVLSNKHLVDKVAGVYLNGRQPLSGKDLRISGKEINLNCTAFYGGTFEGCTFVSGGGDEVLLTGSHIVVTGSQFYGTKFTQTDMEIVETLVEEKITRINKQIDFYEVATEKAFTEEAREEAKTAIVALKESLFDVERVKLFLAQEKELTAVKLT